MYRNPSVYEKSVYEFSLIRDAQINTCFFFNLQANFRLYELLPLANRPLFPSGSNRKLIFVLRVSALRAVSEERIKLENRWIIVLIAEELWYQKEGGRVTILYTVWGSLWEK
jgi:hypothetical protein